MTKKLGDFGSLIHLKLNPVIFVCSKLHDRVLDYVQMQGFGLTLELGYICRYGTRKELKQFYKANKNRDDVQWNTGLQIAALNNRFEIVKMLRKWYPSIYIDLVSTGDRISPEMRSYLEN